MRPSTAGTYVAGIGAGGALLASSFVILAVMAGVVTFHSWPSALGMLNGEAGHISLAPGESSGVIPAGPKALTPRAHHAFRRPGPGRRAARTSSGRGSGAPGGTRVVPPSNAEQGPVVTLRPPSAPPEQRSGNIVSEAVSAAGNTVEGTTTTVGNTLGGSSGPGLGGLVGNAGRTVNQNLQTLAGNG